MINAPTISIDSNLSTKTPAKADRYFVSSSKPTYDLMQNNAAYVFNVQQNRSLTPLLNLQARIDYFPAQGVPMANDNARNANANLNRHG